MRSKSRRWIGVDGEGVGRLPHRYVLLACSDGDYVQDPKGLSTVKCLNFLLNLGSRDGKVCGYSIGYDWTMILQDMPDLAIWMLYRPALRALPSGAFSRVKWKGYELHWLAGAMWLRKGKRKVTIWDHYKYYQQPFCKMEGGKLIGALVDWKVRPDVQERIAEMKEKRSSFTYKQIKRMREYCLSECEALAELATKLEAAHVEAELKPRSWFGPGSSAGLLLHANSIHERRGFLPPPLYDPVNRAFFGGRAEISCNGFVKGPIWGYDISSAYPYHASKLPCLEHSRWQLVKTEKAITGRDVVHAIVYGHIQGTKGAWAPLPVRLPKGHALGSNRIVFPHSGASGWWWRDEWIAAREGWKGLKFDHAYVLRRECHCKPFMFLPPLFDLRRRLGKDSGKGKVLKLTINSVYGKLAQTIGKAQYASRVWSGMITSGTRAQVLRLMLRHKKLDNVLMIATDGIFSRERHSVDKEITLGGWERSEAHKSITLVRPGMYWLGEDKLRARGIGRDQLEAAKAELTDALEHGEPYVDIPKAYFGGATLCVYGKDAANVKRSAAYGLWHLSAQRTSLLPGPKRTAAWHPPTLTDVESAPYGTATTAQTTRYFKVLESLREYMHDR